jgi:putative hydrolase of HD superfamily
MNKRILFLIQQAGMLMHMPRTHKKNLGNTFDTVASHSHHSSIIAYCIARMENLSHNEGLQVMAMATLHDLAEARTGDFDFVGKNYSKTDERKATRDTFAGIDFSMDLQNLIIEYEKRESILSKCAKDADLIEQMYQEWVLMWQGNKLAQKWFEGKQRLTVPKLYTNSAKQIIESMKNSNPQEWWWKEFVDKNYNSENLTGR